MPKFTLIGAIGWFDGKLFDDLVLPEGIDKEIFINTVVERGGEFELLYSDLDFFKRQIPLWGRKWKRTFDKWVYALSLEYNPIENYDKIEEYETIANGKSNSKRNEKISAFNSEQLRNNSENSADEDFQNNNKTIGRTHGNIGVTTSDQMLKAHLDLMEWNIYEHMADIFIEEFMIPIY